MKIYIFLIIFFLLIFISDNSIAKIIYPNDVSLPTIKSEAVPNNFGGMNKEEAQAIRNNLDKTSQTLDALKLEENAKINENKVINSVSKQNNIVWIIILFLMIILVSIVFFRFFRNDEK